MGLIELECVTFHRNMQVLAHRPAVMGEWGWQGRATHLK